MATFYRPKKGKKNTSQRIVDEAGWESFPSSDPPPWTLGTDKSAFAANIPPELDIGHMLREEHHAIRSQAAALNEIIKAIEQHKSIKNETLKTSAQFFTKMVDERHHKKEELLFAALCESETGPTEYLLNDLKNEHELGKELHAALLAWLAQPTDAEKLLPILKSIINLHQNHTLKEEEYVFPYIEKTLSDKDREKLAKAFKEIDKKTYQVEKKLTPKP